jgi:hypothetical protein
LIQVIDGNRWRDCPIDAGIVIARWAKKSELCRNLPRDPRTGSGDWLMRAASNLISPRLAAAFVALGLAATPASAGDRIAMRVEVYGLMGLHVLTLNTSVDEAGDRYAINTHYATTGVAGLVIDQTTRATTVGRLIPASAQPELFRSETRRNGVERRDQVDYRPDGSVEGSSTKIAFDATPPAATRGTVDNLTAYFRLERQLAAKGTCALTVPVFDGRFRYDLVFADAGKRTLAPEGGQRLEGPAIACRMTRRDSGPVVPEQSEGAKQGTFWYAPLLPGDVVVPVRMQLETQIGTVDAYLAELHGRGVDLQLMK